MFSYICFLILIYFLLASSSTQITPIKIYKPYVGVGDNTTAVCSNATNTTSANYSSADAEMFQSITCIYLNYIHYNIIYLYT